MSWRAIRRQRSGTHSGWPRTFRRSTSSTAEIVGRVEGQEFFNEHSVRVRAHRIAKLSRSTWLYLQHGRTKGRRPSEDQLSDAVPRADAEDRVLELRELVLGVLNAVRDERRYHRLDVAERQRVLDDLSRINDLARRLELKMTNELSD